MMAPVTAIVALAVGLLVAVPSTATDATDAIVGCVGQDSVSLFSRFEKMFNRRYASPEARSRAQAVFCRKVADAARRSALGAATFTAFVASGDREAAEVSHHRRRLVVPEARRDDHGNVDFWQPPSGSGSSVPPVKHWPPGPVWNNGQCGSDWASTIVDNIMIQQYTRTGKMVPLSMQELVSCDTLDQGCDGGFFTTALEYIVTQLGGAVLTNASFPYTSGSGDVPNCTTRGEVGAYVKGQIVVPANEDDFTRFVGLQAPLAVALNLFSLDDYTGGIVSGPQCNASGPADTALLLVGYDDLHRPPYWVLKNSFGPTWGEGGFIRIEKGVDCLALTSFNGSSAVLGAHVVPTSPLPVPTTPAPPGPQIVRSAFEDMDCQQNTGQTSFNQNACIPQWDQSGVIMTCDAAQKNIHVTVFLTSDCTGPSSSHEIEVNQCLEDGQGMSVSYSCAPATPTPPAA